MYSISDMDAIFANIFPQAALERCHEIPAVDPIIPMDLGIPQPQFEVLKSGFSSTNFFPMKGRKFQSFPPINKKTSFAATRRPFKPKRWRSHLEKTPVVFEKVPKMPVRFKGPVTQLWVAIGLVAWRLVKFWPFVGCVVGSRWRVVALPLITLPMVLAGAKAGGV